MGKLVIKSVRLSDELLTYIDGYRGDTFTDKLSNIVYDCMLAEPERVKRLKELDQQICRTQDFLRNLSSLTSVFQDWVTLNSKFRDFNTELNKQVLSFLDANHRLIMNRGKS